MSTTHDYTDDTTQLLATAICSKCSDALWCVGATETIAGLELLAMMQRHHEHCHPTMAHVRFVERAIEPMPKGWAL